MRKFLLATTALAMSGIAASAADLPTRKGPPIAPAYIPAFTWTGFYAGLNAGVGWENNNRTNTLPLGAIPVGGFFPSSSSNHAGFVGGAQAGYNYQFGVGQGVVIGAETDFDFADLGRNKNNQVPFTLAQFPGTTFFPGTGHSNGNYLGTVRARIGYAFDRILIFGTGGLAYGNIGRNRDNSFTSVTAAGFPNPVNGAISATPQTISFGSSGSSSTRAGWTLGGGVEYAVWQNWTVKAEYLYYNLGHNNNNTAIAPFLVTTNRHNDSTGNIVRVGVNYKFW
ncbi:MAG: porin family protein [Hyphomicrobiales bacterium]|nr:porin family protein [Hyphomicrobiales bacterium]